MDGKPGASGETGDVPRAGSLALARGGLSTRLAYVAGRRVAVRMAIEVEGDRPRRAFVESRRRGAARVVRRWRVVAEPGRSRHVVRWSGRRGDGSTVRAGAFRLRLRRPSGRTTPIGTVRLVDHAFPVVGPHGVRGTVGRFGVGRTGGRTHEGFDVTAACGTALVAARGGRVVASGYDPVLYGHHVRIAGAGNRLGYFYSHLRERPLVRRGDRVRTGARLGSVGDTGNARGTGCHLHFELRRSGRLLDPEPHLRRWAQLPRPR